VFKQGYYRNINN